MKVRKEQFPTHLSAKIDYRGATALFYAVLNDNYEMAKLLIDAGADPLVKLHQGVSPIEVVDLNSKNGLLIKASEYLDDKSKTVFFLGSADQSDQKPRRSSERKAKEVPPGIAPFRKYNRPESGDQASGGCDPKERKWLGRF